jgi:hypothetical protein
LITSPEAPRTIEMPFRWADIEGTVGVEIAVNSNPEAYGCPEMARGFPRCEATVSTAGVGYDHIYGWIQMVKSPSPEDESQSGFCVDQHPTFASPLPFIYFGPSPRLIDGPHVDDRDRDFLAHTFLCGSGGELHDFSKEARAILGFSWGYSKRDQQIEWFGPEPLSAADWDGHLECLAREREWTFRAGFSQHPLDP